MADNGERLIKVPEQFAKKARIGSIEKYRALYDRSISDPDGFWNEQAERITRFRKWKKTSKFDFHTAKSERLISGKLKTNEEQHERQKQDPRREKQEQRSE